jgi:hypothetical protein
MAIFNSHGSQMKIPGNGEWKLLLLEFSSRVQVQFVVVE